MLESLKDLVDSVIYSLKTNELDVIQEPATSQNDDKTLKYFGIVQNKQAQLKPKAENESNLGDIDEDKR